MTYTSFTLFSLIWNFRKVCAPPDFHSLYCAQESSHCGISFLLLHHNLFFLPYSHNLHFTQSPFFNIPLERPVSETSYRRPSTLNHDKSYKQRLPVESHLVTQFSLDTTTSRMPLQVAVIGGGAAGLVTLKYLLEAHKYHPGVDIIVDLYEAHNKLGGVFEYQTYESAEVRLAFSHCAPPLPRLLHFLLNENSQVIRSWCPPSTSQPSLI